MPDAAAEAATREIMEEAAKAGLDDLVLALISRGGSSLLSLPRPPLTLDDLIAVNRLLLASGLSISEMNKVRRRLSQVKGGGLARAAGKTRLVTLAISDVPGDDPQAIASGRPCPTRRRRQTCPILPTNSARHCRRLHRTCCAALLRRMANRSSLIIA